jgi:hypothetical protein
VGGTVTTLRVGDAPTRQSGLGGQWAAAWNVGGVVAEHKADVTNSATAWSPVKYDAISNQLLSGGDIFAGDLGVSGQSAATSTVRQEIDGKEALRFTTPDAASSVTVKLSNFFLQDDGGLLAEAGRLRLIDDQGHVVGETTFQANSTDGTRQLTLTPAHAFVAMELTAGVYDGSTFVFGGYGDGQGGFGSGITLDGAGKAHGSDYLVDWVEFSFTATAVQPVNPVGLPPQFDLSGHILP